MERRTRTWIAIGLGVLLLTAALVAAALFMLLRSGVTRPVDNMFGDQHLKTAVALVELHKVRYGRYPRRLAELRYTGQWDQLALGSVSYCANEAGDSYYVEVQRGWAGKPALELPADFWQGTGFRRELGPCP